MTKTETIKITVSGISAGMMALFGNNYKLILLLLVFMAADTLTGHLRAWRMKNWTSNKARWGLIGKLVELVLIALMYMCEWCFGIDWLVNTVVTYFIICEGASILENIVKGHLNGNVPPEVIDFMTKLKTNFLTGFKEWMKKFFGGDGGEDH